MNDSGILFVISRALLFLFALFGLLIVPFGGGCAMLFALDRAREIVFPLGGAMALSIIGNILLLRFAATGDPLGPVAKTIMALLAALDFVLAVVAIGQATDQEPGPVIIAVLLFVKGITTLIFAFATRADDAFASGADDPPTFPTLRP
jgi:hypothetical protein